MTVLTFGELLLRLSPPGEERLLDSPVLHTFFGGAEANVAVALRHLGVPASYITRLPEGPLGDAGLDALRREDVVVDRVLRAGGGSRLGLYFVEPGADLRAMRVVYDRAGSAFSQITPADVDWGAALAHAKWLHGTGITPALGDGPARALSEGFAAACERGVTVSLDLNYREALWRGRDPRPVLERLARQANVLIGNREAVRAMLGAEASGDALASALADRFGCRAVAITQREILGPREHAWSAVLYDSRAGTVVRSYRHVVQVVDRVGGGDSFTAGLIAALLADRSPQDAVEFAAAAGALKLGQAGDFGRSSTPEVSRLVETARCT
ncbi:MAG: 2-dehydro-3-deoxygluconokinase [Gemmatimonadetes bacterium]|nr:MAG: 2-dehydro-3-deoxygluconokinase [Gemmatimonadota bacterium]